MTPVSALLRMVSSVWLSGLSRQQLSSGELAASIARGSVTGAATSPLSFADALTGDDHYRAQLTELAAFGLGVDAAARAVVIDDVRAACDLLAQVHLGSGGRDGYVTVGGASHFADADAILDDVVEWRKAVDRPNVMIQLPATPAGLAAMTGALARGISVHAVGVFGLDSYRAVIKAYLGGLERAAAKGQDLSMISSVVSINIASVGALIDESLLSVGSDRARHLLGKTSIAYARLASQVFDDGFGSDRFARLAYAGAHKQRHLGTATDLASIPMRNADDPFLAHSITATPKTPLSQHPDVETDATQMFAAPAAARRHLQELSDIGIDLADITDIQQRTEIATELAQWDDLRGVVRDQLALIYVSA